MCVRFGYNVLTCVWKAEWRDNRALSGIRHRVLLLAPAVPVEIIKLFGSKDKYELAVRDLESALYTLAK